MKALIFDMDGVIIDSEKVYEQVDQQWFAENGIKTDRIALRQCLGCTDDVNWGMIARWNPELDIAAAFQKYCAFCKDDPYFGQDLSKADVRVDQLEQIVITDKGLLIGGQAL